MQFDLDKDELENLVDCGPFVFDWKSWISAYYSVEDLLLYRGCHDYCGDRLEVQACL